MRRRSRAVCFVVAAVMAAIVFVCRRHLWDTSPEAAPDAAMRHFYSPRAGEAAEEQMMDPLILAGEDVVPLVLRDIRKKHMPRRRYAIGFLGNGGYRQALPQLEEILADTTEISYFRTDALESIYRIDPMLGSRHARRHEDRGGPLGDAARSILKGDPYLKERRSYQEALTSYKD